MEPILLKEPLTFIDLFCGIGGFHQALKKLGAKCILACDINKDCREVYLDNYGIKPVEDVKKINPIQLPDFDILTGGFPCQAFSNGGKKKCFEDSRGLLFDEIIRIAKVKKPKFMFLENVKHILKVSDGEVINYIKEKINFIGYNLTLFQLSPHNYGIPQQRERVYFVCVLKTLQPPYNSNPTIVLNPSIDPKTIDFNKFINSENVSSKYYINSSILKTLEAWDEIIKQMEVGEKLTPTLMINDAFINYSEEQLNLFPAWKRDIIKKNRPLVQKYYTILDTWYSKHKALLKQREIFGKLEWQAGPITKNESIFNHFIQIRQSGIRVKKCKYFPTLVAISQIPIYGKEKRYITPRECARLQSFPEDFKLSIDDKKSYKQLGNSVNVENVFNVISSTLKHYAII
jgi:DNA (cytosine-5)-methyltransferase 1